MTLDLELVKKHLNIDSDYTDDDDYIESITDVAELIVLKQLDFTDSASAFDSSTGKYHKPIQQAILLLVGTYYANRESVTFGAGSVLPHGFEHIIMLCKDYSPKN